MAGERHPRLAGKERGVGMIQTGSDLASAFVLVVANPADATLLPCVRRIRIVETRFPTIPEGKLCVSGRSTGHCCSGGSAL